jgi:hypothetical protein
MMALMDGGTISGATTAVLTISPATTGDSGTYDCVVTGACGNGTSPAATLTVSSDSSGPLVTPPADATVTQTLCN